MVCGYTLDAAFFLKTLSKKADYVGSVKRPVREGVESSFRQMQKGTDRKRSSSEAFYGLTR